MSTAPMTPTEDPFDPSATRSWSSASPRSDYDASFEDAVMRIVLSPPHNDGIVLLNEGDEPPIGIESVQRTSVEVERIPNFAPSALPLPLNHPLRIYRSSVPGIRLTHPGGDLEGGEGPGSLAQERAGFARELIDDNRIRNAPQFWRVVEQEKGEALKELEEKMRARQDAIRQNEKLENQLDALKEQRDLEVRVWNRRKGLGKG
ncbi:hypothetical protein NA57DRAFT_53274 [Rhizodiscina lignyota]|uniref:Uncharacterized protein n=1 Tax=Rhizodiscina lignyota TaxID=1504668 RepID=A0A9P4IGS6_9PEZI|nr:hypothetical protein NA57DRAFT_53274 [Rhizodiscina lignyota]